MIEYLKYIMEYVQGFLLGTGVLLVLVGIWIGIYLWLTPHVKEPDGKARITGSCGDTIEMCLQFNDDRVTKTSYWTDGCTYSFNCAHAATELAKGKTPDEIIEIDADRIQEYIGGLPRDHYHCASLAAETLMAALDDYMRKQTRKHAHTIAYSGV
jgi:NifU-like protein involved in Fe-S cluster formation